MLDEVHIVESREARLELHESEVLRLTDLSRELASSRSWWGADDDQDEPERNIIAISPRGPGIYAVTVRNAVGAISLGNKLLVVEPKIPLKHFIYIARYALSQDNRTLDDPLKLAAGQSFQDLLAGWLIENFQALSAAGLSMDYEEEIDDLSYVRGKIDVTKTSLRILTGSLSIRCEFEERTLNSPENRIIKSALEVINSSSLATNGLKSALNRSRRTLKDVELASLADLRLPERIFPSRYRNTVDLALSVLRYSGLSLFHGQRAAKSFLVRTPGLVEKGIRRIVEIGLKPVEVKEGGRTLLPTSLRVKPDLVLARPPFTADVKYKIFGSMWNRSDLAQGVFFAEAYGSPIAAVIGFSPGELRLPVVPVGKIKVTPVSWNVSPEQEPRDSAEAVLEALRSWLPENERAVIA
jgi:hypothetical protein